MSVFAGPEIASSNLVFAVDFNNSKSISGTTLTNIGSRNISVALVNAANNTLVVANGYAQFSPASESTQSTYYSISNTYFNDIRNEMTIEACVYTSSYPVGGNRMISTRTTEGGQSIGFQMGATTVGTEVNSGGTWRTADTTIGSTSNVWIHVIQTTSNVANVMITYINGRSVAQTAIPGTLANGSGFLIGRGFYGGDRYPAGRLSFFRVYDRALSAAEIQQNFNALRGRFGI
jgi:hypothetical protein